VRQLLREHRQKIAKLQMQSNKISQAEIAHAWAIRTEQFSGELSKTGPGLHQRSSASGMENDNRHRQDIQALFELVT
jgi:hypothetical protein